MPTANTPRPIQIFRAGRHVSANGESLSFSEADLAASAAAYDPAKHEAPLVVGHPRHDAPAYGWVESLAGGTALEAVPHQLDPAFAEMVGRGAFKKISASFYSPDSPQNPVPGVYYLRHVGFLGAQPPAVKGLRSPEFADAETGVVEFADWSDMQNAGLWRTLREWIISFRGLEEADKAVPGYAVATLEDAARSEAADEAAPASSFTELTHQEITVTPAEAAAMQAENARLKQENAAAKAAADAARAASVHAGNAAFAEGLIKAGKMLPVHQGFIVAFMDQAAEAGVVEFGEGSAKVQKGALEGLKDYLAAQPKIVEFGEVAGGDVAQGEQSDPTMVARQAVEFQEAEAKAGRTVDIARAVAHVTRKT